jgi:predicted secreted Zn-dependent protease
VAAVAILLAACTAGRPSDRPPPALPPGIVDHRAERFYEVEGTTRDELIREIRSKGPVSGTRRVWGRHEWDLRWSYRSAHSSGLCRMTEVRITLESVTTLPRWTTRERADSSLVLAWDAMIEALRVHENGHRDIAYRAAREVQRTLRRTTDPNGSFLGTRANDAARETLERYREINRQYDEETRSGQAQGVTLGPPGGGARF